jgi:hypothetical protein
MTIGSQAHFSYLPFRNRIHSGSTADQPVKVVRCIAVHTESVKTQMMSAAYIFETASILEIYIGNSDFVPKNFQRSRRPIAAPYFAPVRPIFSTAQF